MILLAIAAIWMLILTLVTGLCVAARSGDLKPPEHGEREAASSQVVGEWEPVTLGVGAIVPAARAAAAPAYAPRVAAPARARLAETRGAAG